MKRIISTISFLLIAALLLLGMVGCNSEAPTDTEESESKSATVGATEPQIEGKEIELSKNVDKLKIWGRYKVTNSGIACDNTASGIEFNANVKGSVYLDIRSSDDAYFTVFIDGVRQRGRSKVSGGRTATRLKIAEFSDMGEHNIRVLKQTEAQYATADFKTLVIDGELIAPPAAKDKYIEFIGDSISCGMGNLGYNGVAEAQTALYEDGTSGYAFLTAEALGADCSIVSQSGIGIAGSWNDPIGEFYSKLPYKRDTNTDNDFSRVPDIVVINLGTNDYNLNLRDESKCTPEQVQTKTAELIELVRSSYGEQVPIIWAYGAMGECMFDSVKAAIDGLGGEAAGIFTCQLTEKTSGAAGHPNKEGHEIASNELKNFILEVESK